MMQTNALQHLSLQQELIPTKSAIPFELFHIYYTLFDTIPDSLFILQDCKILDCNVFTEKVFGLSRFSLVNQSFLELLYNNNYPADAKLVRQTIQQCLHKGVQKCECRYYNDRILEIVFSPFPAANYVLAVVRDITPVNKNLNHSSQALEDKRIFAEKLLQASEDEKRRISREIHDSLGQLLFALQLEISAAKSALPKHSKRAESLLCHSEELLSKSICEAEELCHRLRPRVLDDFGLAEALQYLAEPAKKMGIQVTISSRHCSRQKQSVESALYRICQEALSNTLKHADASNIEISLNVSEHHIYLSISDNGRGFDVEAVHQNRRGFGLMNMRERVELLNGEFDLSSKDGKGTKIDITIPIE